MRRSPRVSVLRGLLEGVRWLGEPGTITAPAGPSGISQARSYRP
ncbi:hypothetical protein [Gemmatimonas sp.]